MPVRFESPPPIAGPTELAAKLLAKVELVIVSGSVLPLTMPPPSGASFAEIVELAIAIVPKLTIPPP